MYPIIIFLILIIFAPPLVAVITLTTATGLYVSNLDLSIIPMAFYSGLDQLPLSAIAGFVLAGSLMGPAGLTGELVSISQKIIGHLRGSLALSTIMACFFFSALSGSGGATCAAVGAVMIPVMIKNSYPPDYAGSMAATGGVLGILIPPSIPMIIYATQSNVSINKLFISGIFPGIVLMLGLLFAAWLDAKIRKIPLQKFTEKQPELLKTIWNSKWSLALPVIIMGGIWFGFFTPTEASITAVLWTLIVGISKKKLNMQAIFQSLRETSILAGGAIIILAPATAMARYFSLISLPQKIATLVTSTASGPISFLFILAVALLACGLFADTLSMIAILTPIFLPVARELGVDLVVMGLVFILCCEAGFLTPPFGGNLFIAARLADCDFNRLALAALPYVFVIIILIALIILVPEYFLWPIKFMS